MDRLEEMFSHQRKFQERLASKAGYEFPPRDPAKLMQDVIVAAYAICDEVHEATNETGWKPWATSNHLNRDNYLGELVDAWHFFMNLCLLADITPQELYEGYMQKISTNHQRQDQGYDGISSKCPRCKRAYDGQYSSHEGPVRPFVCQPAHMHTNEAGRPTGRTIPAWCGEIQTYVNTQGHPTWDQTTQAMTS